MSTQRLVCKCLQQLYNSPKCKQLKCQSICKCFNNLWHTQAMDKWEGTNSWYKQHGWILNVMLSEGSMTRKCQYHMIPFTWNSLASSSQSILMNADQWLPKYENEKRQKTKKNWGAIEMSYILTMAWVYTFVNPLQTVHLKCVHFLFANY